MPAALPLSEHRDVDQPHDQANRMIGDATPSGYRCAFNEGGESGMRRILKPATSGNHSAASEDTSVKTAAGTSPLINRSTAFV
jgi:hypothetical protein